MKAVLALGFLLLAGSLAGLVVNIVSGFSLTRAVAADSDFHLSIALSTVAMLIIGSLVFVFSSRRLIALAEESTLMTKTDDTKSLASILNLRLNAVNYSIFSIVCSIVNIISGTISQTGRFPLIHGLFGFALTGLAAVSLVLWSRVSWRLFAFEK